MGLGCYVAEVCVLRVVADIVLTCSSVARLVVHLVFRFVGCFYDAYWRVLVVVFVCGALFDLLRLLWLAIDSLAFCFDECVSLVWCLLV